MVSGQWEWRFTWSTSWRDALIHAYEDQYMQAQLQRLRSFHMPNDLNLVAFICFIMHVKQLM